MKLGRKNLVYSLILAGIMLLFLVGYFIYMLPSLYVDYVMEQNLKSVKEQHNAYIKNGTYEGISVRNPSACYSVEIPKQGDSIFVTGKVFSIKITVKEENLKQLLADGRKIMQSYETKSGNSEKEETAKKENNEIRQELEKWVEQIAASVKENTDLPIEIEFLYMQDTASEYKNEKINVHAVTDTMMVLETSIEDSANHYTNYIAVERTNDSMVVTILPVMTPDMNEIRPVVLSSLPMLGAVILFLVLLFSQIYSKGIVSPIVQLVYHTEQMKYTEGFAIEPLKASDKWKSREDEVGELADTMDELYEQIRESYQKLEEKNAELAEENRRQEVFLRASSHQLKTPISAALLLVDGMINEIGKYKEREVYLPKVKEQLLSMRKMVEDILYLNHCSEHIRMQQMDVRQLLQKQLNSYQVAIAEKALKVELKGLSDMEIYTDEMMISQILDNVMSNAVKYTPEREKIQIEIKEQEIQIENYGVTISEEILPHIFDPFVSGNHGTGSHGLGLYIAAYYAKKIGVELEINNGENRVVTTVSFRDNRRAEASGNENE